MRACILLDTYYGKFRNINFSWFFKLLRDVTSLTASIWLKESLCKIGTDTSLFNGHST